MTATRKCLPNLAAATLLAAGFAALLAAGAASSAQAADRQCQAAVEQHLQTQGLNAETIAKTSYITVIANLEFGNLHGYEAWTPLPSCTGSLVTKLSTSCQVKETYTRGNCTLQNAKK